MRINPAIPNGGLYDRINAAIRNRELYETAGRSLVLGLVCFLAVGVAAVMFVLAPAAIYAVYEALTDPGFRERSFWLNQAALLFILTAFLVPVWAGAHLSQRLAPRFRASAPVAIAATLAFMAIGAYPYLLAVGSVTYEVFRVNLPAHTIPPNSMVVRGTATIEGRTITSATVEALVGGIVCGYDISGDSDSLSPGAFEIIVKSDDSLVGCGKPGAQITFRVNGRIPPTTSEYAPQGSADLKLELPPT